MTTLNKFLYLIWKNPQTRDNYVVGKLTKNGNYKFEYFGDFGKAESNGWSRLEAFPEEKVYESDTLFPVFSSRLPDKKRRDIKRILEKYELSAFDEFELLRKSEGRLPIDTYSFIDPIFPETETVQRDFYVMGIRYNSPCKGKDCELLPMIAKGDELVFERESTNQHDSNAVKILTKSGDFLGYVPRYYSQPVAERLDKGLSYRCMVIDVVPDKDCSECVKARLNMPRI